MSQISQAPPPISHSDHCHLSFNSNHLQLINTQLNQHYLSTHLTSDSCPILLTRSGLTPTRHSYLPQDYLPQDYLPQDYLPQDYLPQDYLPQDYLPQDYLPQDYLPQDYLPQDYLPQDYLPQDYLPQDYLPQDYLPPVPRWSSVSPTSACLRPSPQLVFGVDPRCVLTTSSTSSWQENHHQYIL